MSDQGPVRTSGLAIGVLALCACMNLLARGLADTFSVFLLPLEQSLGGTRTALTAIYSIFMLAQGLSAIPAGILLDRLGPRALYMVGLACLGSGVLLAGRATELWQLYLCLGVLVGLGSTGLGMVPSAALVSRWFPDRTASAMGISHAGFGVGVLLLVPTAQLLIGELGWRESYAVLGTAVLVLLLPVLLLPWRRIAGGAESYQQREAQRRMTESRWTLPRAVRTAGFWGLFGAFFFTSLGVFNINPQLVAFLVSEGFSPGQAAFAFGINGMLAIAGVMATGWLADRFGRRRVVTASYSLTLGGIAMLFAVAALPVLPLLALHVLLFGLSMGARGPVISALAARLFPGAGFGTVYGTITLGAGTGAACGAAVSGFLYDLTGGYHALFAFSACAIVIALSLFWLIPALSHGRHGR